jgi:hypothetical protein
MTEKQPKSCHNYENSARIDGINKNLLMRCADILQHLSSGFQINTSFHKYELEAERLYDHLYI